MLTLLERLAPGLAADPPLVELALDSAVRLEISLRWPDGFVDSEFTGSGWTRKCQPAGAAFEVILATAGHVVDVPALEDEARPGPHPHATVKVVVIYRDGRQYTAGREDLRVDRLHDYGEVHTTFPVARTVLPTGGAAEMRPGSHVFSIASPGLLAYACFDGSISTLDAHLVSNAPSGSVLSSLPVAPGASGAPVLTENGHVVAFVDGFVEWSWGTTASILVALPSEIPSLAPVHDQTQEGMNMGLLESLFPFVKLTGAVAIAIALLGTIRSRLGGAARFTPEALDIVVAIAEKVVMAVEQAHGDLAGVDKKRLATEIVGDILSRLHIQAPQALVDAAIEAAVLALERLAGKVA